MKVGKTLYVTNRKDWRTWLKQHHKTESEIWLVFYRKASDKPSLHYNDAVEEALCFGWIDSIVKKVDDERRAQRFSPRKPKSVWSAMNIERVRRLIAKKQMTEAGRIAARWIFETAEAKSISEKLIIAPDILKQLKKDKTTWENFQRFPESYKRIRIGWIEGARSRTKLFDQRLTYFIKMTSQNKRYGMVQ